MDKFVMLPEQERAALFNGIKSLPGAGEGGLLFECCREM